jgi:plasmid replication initiation protein
MKLEKEYAEYKYFKRDIIEKAIKEINEITSIYVEYEEVKDYRKTTEIIFKIKHFTERKIERD